jgi:hypothetical protein
MTTMNQNGTRMSRDKDSSHDEFEDLKRLIHGKLVDKLDLSRLGDLQGDTLGRVRGDCYRRVGRVQLLLLVRIAGQRAAG